MKKDKLFIRVIMSIIGMIILGIGVFFTIKVNLGSDPASTLQLGMAKQLGISYGLSTVIFNIVFLIIIFCFDKKYINISSILAIFIIGYTVEGMNLIFGWLDLESFNLIYKLIICLIGTFVISIGVTVYIFSDLGVGATDGISELISDKTKFHYRTVRFVSDLILVILGYLLGSVVGIGTVLITFSVGPFIQLNRKIMAPLLKKVVGVELVEDVNSHEDKFEKEVIA